MFMFVMFSTFLAGTKTISFFGRSSSSIKLVETSNNLYNQRALFSILNTPVENKKTIKELIILNDKEKAEEEIRKILDNTNRNCYFFKANYDSDDEIKIEKGTGMNKVFLAISDPNLMGSADYYKSINSEEYTNLLGEFSKVDIYSSNQKINLLIYTSEKC